MYCETFWSQFRVKRILIMLGQHNLNPSKTDPAYQVLVNSLAFISTVVYLNRYLNHSSFITSS